MPGSAPCQCHFVPMMHPCGMFFASFLTQGKINKRMNIYDVCPTEYWFNAQHSRVITHRRLFVCVSCTYYSRVILRVGIHSL